MDRMTAGDTAQRINTLLEELGGMLAMVPRLLDENNQLKHSSESAAREVEHLRSEVAVVREELQQFSSERTEFQEVFTKTMNEIIDLMNQVVPRLQTAPRRAALGRESEAPVDHPGRPTLVSQPPTWRA